MYGAVTLYTHMPQDHEAKNAARKLARKDIARRITLHY